MQITVSGHQVEITEPLREYTSEKIGRLQKHFDDVINTKVVLHVQKNLHKAEATIHAPGTTLHANAEGSDMYAAIDALADKLDRQMLRHRGKAANHHRGEASLKKLETP
ncbi:MAG: ribosome-associated translation inhibitor RaiA [Pseudomonadota bacterium]|jgi:putative sigma-54 modulation protein